MLFGFESKDDLINRAKNQGKKAPKSYQKAVELYYITRYFVSVFEARNHEIPLQVWNEYRNALDHFFRHLTLDNNPDISQQLTLMENHIKRAALDVIKLTCHKSDEWLSKELAKYNEQALLLVDNGNFIKSIRSRHIKAESDFLTAKTEDHNFGQDKVQNKKILSLYINAAFAYEELREEIEARIPDILNYETELLNITAHAENNAHKKSFFPSVGASLFATLIWTIFVAIISYNIGTPN